MNDSTFLTPAGIETGAVEVLSRAVLNSARMAVFCRSRSKGPVLMVTAAHVAGYVTKVLGVCAVEERNAGALVAAVAKALPDA